MALNVLPQVFEYNQHFVAMMNIINSSRLNPPTKGHKHHIIPKCWFKMNNLPIDNSKDNLVLLSYEDHIKVHKLSILCAATPEMKSKMGFAVKRLLKGNFSGMHHTEESRRKNAEAHKGKTLSVESRGKLSESMKGKNKGKFHSEESRRKNAEAHKGKTLSVESRKKISEALKGDKNPFYGKKHSNETLKKMSESLKGKRKGMTWKILDGHRVWYNKEIV